MSLLKRILLARSVQYTCTANYNKVDYWQSTQLTHRALIRVRGEESSIFLQGLVTNDMNTLTEQERKSESIYCMFLNTGGRVLFDSIICPGFEPDEYILEVDSDLAKAAVKHLKMYKVRRRLKIEEITDLNVFAVFNINKDITINNVDKQTQSPIIGSTYCDGGSRIYVLPAFQQTDALCAPDPRVDSLGYRYISTDSCPPEKGLPLPVAPVDLDTYTMHRFRLGVPEGKQELIPAKAMPLECNMDYLHGVSFHKGCYIGQELTARTHHTGVIRKRILPLQLLDLPNNQPDSDESVLNEAGKPVGKLRRLVGNYGLGLLRLQETFSASSLTCAGLPVTTWKPDWWPKDKKENAEGGSS